MAKVVKEKTFLAEQDIAGPDNAAAEGLKILESEYEIFTDPNLPSTKALARFDTWDEVKSIEEWIAQCQATPNQPHAMSPVFENNEYVWRHVSVLDYDKKEKKFKVVVCHTGQKKSVGRLSLLFLDEDPAMFKRRVNMCRQR